MSKNLRELDAKITRPDQINFVFAKWYFLSEGTIFAQVTIFGQVTLF